MTLVIAGALSWFGMAADIAMPRLANEAAADHQHQRDVGDREQR